MIGEQLTRIKPERSMSTETMIELLIQLIKCIIKSEEIYAGIKTSY
ncbi:unnamed protein product, partial [Rotaria socialis]